MMVLSFFLNSTFLIYSKQVWVHILLNTKRVETLSCLRSNRAITETEGKFENQTAKILFH